MAKKVVEFADIFENKKPIFAYNPPGILDIQLIQAVNKADAIGLINLERLRKQEMKKLLHECQQKLDDVWGVRVSTKEQFEVVIDLAKDNNPKMIIISDFDLTKNDLEAIQKFKIIPVGEVTSLEEAYEKKWARFYLIKGNEAGGRVGDETSFILSHQFADAGLPFVVQGGIGLYTAGAVLAIGALGVVLDSQLYLTPESSLDIEIKDYISKIDATNTRVICDTTKKKYRVYARLATKIVKDYIKYEKDFLSIPLNERTEKMWEKIQSERAMFESKDISNKLLPIGQDIAFAKILTEKFGTVEGIINGILNQTQTQIKSTSKSYPFKENQEIAGL